MGTTRRADGRARYRTGLMLAGAAGAVLLARVLRGSGPSLAGRVVLITGGSRGLGLVLAREAAAQGARVAICARDPETLEQARASLAASRADVMAVTCDVADRLGARADRGGHRRARPGGRVIVTPGWSRWARPTPWRCATTKSHGHQLLGAALSYPGSADRHAAPPRGTDRQHHLDRRQAGHPTCP
jgi:hypothetical protein